MRPSWARLTRPFTASGPPPNRRACGSWPSAGRRAHGRGDRAGAVAKPAARVEASEAALRCRAAAAVSREPLGLLPRAAPGHAAQSRPRSSSPGSNPDDPCSSLDRERAAQVREERARQAAEELPDVRDGGEDPQAAAAADDELHATLLQEAGQEASAMLLDIGTGTGRILHWLGAARARGDWRRSVERCAARRADQRARRGTDSLRAAAGRHVRAAVPPARSTLITFDRVLVERKPPGARAGGGGASAAAEGRLIIVEDYDRLDAGPAPARHPLRSCVNGSPSCGLALRAAAPGRHATGNSSLPSGADRRPCDAAA